jgi:hypothetical protein
MNTSTLKTFAQAARRKLIQLIGARLDYVLTADTAELRQQATQVNELRTALRREGRDLLIERVAYTWFNRLAALRFMDANGFHPFGARVISPATANETLPELLQQARAGVLDADLRESLAHPKTFDDLLSGRIPVSHPEAQVYRLLLLAVCHHYHRLMPFLFEKMGAATELRRRLGLGLVRRARHHIGGAVGDHAAGLAHHKPGGNAMAPPQLA